MSDVVVVGGGAAGLMAAIFAGRAGARVTILEASKACGLKILVSGGGRCNLLPVASELDDFFTTGSRNVLRRLFRTWSLEAVGEFFERDLEIPLSREETSGKIFPASQSARSVRDTLVAAAKNAGTEIRLGHRVQRIERSENGFVVHGREEGRPCETAARSVVLAAGGQSLPKTGSDGSGFSLAEDLGHALIDRYPALVPLRSPDLELRALSGVSVPVHWVAHKDGKALEARCRELLFTHRGYSGPAILDASHWVVRDGAQLRVAWGALDEEEWTRELEAASRKRLDVLLGEFLPRRLAETLLDRAQIPGKVRAVQLNPKQHRRLMQLLCSFELPIDGDEGYRKAEMTGGGVALGDVNPSTLESRRAPGVYVCGELFDVLGRMGGFNFLWAWITGRLAGESAAAAGLETSN